MKVNTLPGEFGFRALVKPTTVLGDYEDAWKLTAGFYFSLAEVQKNYGTEYWQIKWPVEMQGDSIVYVPAPEELA